MGASESSPSVGITSSLLDNSTTEHYASIITDLAKAGALLTSRGLIWNALCKDARCSNNEDPQVLALRIKNSASTFFDLRQLYDREGTMHSLLTRMSEKGQFILFVGGKNIGKSYMLRAAAAELNRSSFRVVVVDASRTGSDLAVGIAESLESISSTSFVVAATRCLGGIIAAATDVVTTWGEVVSAKNSIRDLLEAAVVGAEAEGKTLVLIVDEANTVLKANNPKTTRSDALDFLALVPKQERRATVVLAASDFSEQSRLEAMGFRTDQLTAVIVASEVPPAKMYALLLDQWHCGPHLAEALVSVYGGHLWIVFQALIGLAYDYDSFQTMAPFAGVLINGAATCLTSVSPPMKARMASLLRALAEDGFAPLASRSDECALVVSGSGVGGIVARSALAAGVPPQAWSSGDHDFVLVPCLQAMRLLLCRSREVQQAIPLLRRTTPVLIQPRWICSQRFTFGGDAVSATTSSVPTVMDHLHLRVVPGVLRGRSGVFSTPSCHASPMAAGMLPGRVVARVSSSATSDTTGAGASISTSASAAH
jgi:hypothetical protein